MSEVKAKVMHVPYVPNIKNKKAAQPKPPQRPITHKFTTMRRTGRGR